jgi:hypothetical protein
VAFWWLGAFFLKGDLVLELRVDLTVGSLSSLSTMSWQILVRVGTNFT